MNKPKCLGRLQHFLSSRKGCLCYVVPLISNVGDDRPMYGWSSPAIHAVKETRCFISLGKLAACPDGSAVCSAAIMESGLLSQLSIMVVHIAELCMKL